MFFQNLSGPAPESKSYELKQVEGNINTLDSMKLCGMWIRFLSSVAMALRQSIQITSADRARSNQMHAPKYTTRKTTLANLIPRL